MKAVESCFLKVNLQGMFMKLAQKFTSLLFVFVTGCAQVPEQSVELSATVGRDVSAIKESHVALVDIYYDNLITNINHFIDDVYLPYQIQKTLEDRDLRELLMDSIQNAAKPDASGHAQKNTFEFMKIFHTLVYTEVEDYRKLKLAPVLKQKRDMLTNLNKAYAQVLYANQIVTGHLSSIAKVHDAQNEFLSEFDIYDLRTAIGTEAAILNNKIVELTDKAKKAGDDVDEYVSKFNELSDMFK